MSIKALQRRAREARHWLGVRCLPLWSEHGMERGQFLTALAMNHRADGEATLGAAEDQAAMAALFALGPRVGFSSDRIDLDAMQAPTEATFDHNEARTLPATCAALLDALIALSQASGDGETQAAAGDAVAAFDTLMDDFLTPEGGWIEGYTADGLPLSDEIPARLAGPLAAALSPLLNLAEA